MNVSGIGINMNQDLDYDPLMLNIEDDERAASIKFGYAYLDRDLVHRVNNFIKARKLARLNKINANTNGIRLENIYSDDRLIIYSVTSTSEKQDMKYIKVFYNEDRSVEKYVMVDGVGYNFENENIDRLCKELGV